MKSGCSGALKPDWLSLSCKANKYSGAGTRDPGVLTTHKTCFSLGDAASSKIKYDSGYGGGEGSVKGNGEGLG